MDPSIHCTLKKSPHLRTSFLVTWIALVGPLKIYATDSAANNHTSSQKLFCIQNFSNTANMADEYVSI